MRYGVTCLELAEKISSLQTKIPEHRVALCVQPHRGRNHGGSLFPPHSDNAARMTLRAVLKTMCGAAETAGEFNFPACDKQSPIQSHAESYCDSIPNASKDAVFRGANRKPARGLECILSGRTGCKSLRSCGSLWCNSSTVETPARDTERKNAWNTLQVTAQKPPHFMAGESIENSLSGPVAASSTMQDNAVGDYHLCPPPITHQEPGLGSNGECWKERDGLYGTKECHILHKKGCLPVDRKRVVRVVFASSTDTNALTNPTIKTGYEPSKANRQVPSPIYFTNTETKRTYQWSAVGNGVEAPKGLDRDGYKPLMRNRTANVMPSPIGYTADHTFP